MNPLYITIFRPKLKDPHLLVFLYTVSCPPLFVFLLLPLSFILILLLLLTALRSQLPIPQRLQLLLLPLIQVLLLLLPKHCFNYKCCSYYRG